MPCQMCREREWTSAGDAPRCAFDGERFSPDNWNCATANAIRDIAGEYRDDPRPEGAALTFCDDQKYATVRAYEICTEGEDEFEFWPVALWVSWYKRRGRTDAMWLLSPEGAPRSPTEADCRRLIAFYTDTRADAQKG